MQSVWQPSGYPTSGLVAKVSVTTYFLVWVLVTHLVCRHHVDKNHQVGQQCNPYGGRVKAQYNAGWHVIAERSVATNADNQILQADKMQASNSSSSSKAAKCSGTPAALCSGLFSSHADSILLCCCPCQQLVTVLLAP